MVEKSWFSVLCGVLFALSVFVDAGRDRNLAPPNVLFIVADDLGRNNIKTVVGGGSKTNIYISVTSSLMLIFSQFIKGGRGGVLRLGGGSEITGANSANNHLEITFLEILGNPRPI